MFYSMYSKFAMIVVALVMMVGCGSAAPDGGVEAVLIKKPIFFGHGGIEPTPIKTGRTFVALTTDVQYVDMQPRRVDMMFDDLMTSDGVPIDFHAVVTLKVLDSVRLVSGYGNDFMDQRGPGFFIRNLDQPFRTAVRDEVKKHGMQEMAITATAADEVDKVVTEHMKRIIVASGVPVELRDLSLGRANPPDSIKTQRVETAAASQRILTEQQTKLAEDQRRLAEESRAAADAAYNLKMNASGGQNLPINAMLKLREIEMKREVCAKANCTFWFAEERPTVQVKGN